MSSRDITAAVVRGMHSSARFINNGGPHPPALGIEVHALVRRYAKITVNKVKSRQAKTKKVGFLNKIYDMSIIFLFGVMKYITANLFLIHEERKLMISIFELQF